MRHWFILLTVIGLLPCLTPRELRAAPAATQVALQLGSDSARAGDTVLAGLRMTMNPPWHVYWRNPGVGFPPAIQWDLPAGVTAGEIQWPVPHKFITNSFTTYEYAKEVILLIPLKLAADLAKGSHTLTAKVSWLECVTGGQCVPQKTTVTASLNVGEATKPSTVAAQLAAVQKNLPVVKPDLAATARWEKPAGGETRALLIEWPTTAKHPDFFPFIAETFEVEGPTTVVSQTGGKVDAFTCAVGTGGTLAGTGMALKEHNKAVRIVLADPMGSALYHHYAHGELKAEGTSITEGIGQGRITRNLDGAPIDDQVQVTDHEALPLIFNLIKQEGLVLGGSSGINVMAAIKVARILGPGHTVVTVLCDYGTRYQSKLFNPAFLRERDLPVPDWLD